ncbi:MAG: hypothetical protein J6Z79_00030, partial [Clostridia bacterium]|nr:hypothetical protein [Clostridia bacterium]
FGAAYVKDGTDEVTEPFTGVTAPAAVKVTVDGATVGAYYGAKGGVTNQGTSCIDVSIISELKSGVIGKIHMLSDAAQSDRIGGSDSNTPKMINWITLGEENSDKTLTIGDYYAAGEFYPDVEGYNYSLGMGKLYGAQMVMATTVYDNLVLDPAAALTAVNDAGLKKAVYTVTVSGTSHSKSTLAWATFGEGDFAGNFYALGCEVNQNEGEYSGKYAVDCVLDVHGFDLETRANDHLFGNVVTRHKLTTDYAIGSVYVNIEGTEAKPLSITRLAHGTKEEIVPGVEGKPDTTKTIIEDTDEGMILNGITDTATVTYTNASETRGNVVNPFLGDVSISLKYVTLGEEGNQGYIHLMHSMQYRNAVNISLDHCTVNGTFHALSNAAYGEPESMGASKAKTLAQVTNTLTDTAITRGYYGGAVNCYTCADISNVLTDVTIGESYYGGGVRITNTVGADGTTDSRAGVWGVAASGSRSIGTIENTLTGVTIAANYGGGNQNAANNNGGVTNTLNDVVVGDAYFGACRASTTGGSVVNNINGLDIAGYFYGGNDSTGTVNGTITTTVTKFHSSKDKAEIGFYAGNSNGGTGTTVNPNQGEPAIVLTIDPEKDEDVFFSGLICAGSSEGIVKGDIIVNLCGGVQYSTRHLILGNRQTSHVVYEYEADGVTLKYESDGITPKVKTPAKRVEGNITCNVYGGSWGTVYLGGRNNTTAVTDPSTVGDVTLNLYGGSLSAARKGYQDGKGCYVGGNVEVNVHTDAPADPTIVCDDLVIRGSIDPETQTFATDEDHPNAPYKVKVIAGDRILYYGSNSYTYAGGSVSSSVTTASVVADTINGTLKIAPASNYFYPVTCFEGGYHEDATSKGVIAEGFEGSYQWYDGVRLTLKGVSDETLVQAAPGTFSSIAYVQDGENATWVSADERPNGVYGTTIIMDSRFNVRVLFEKEKVESVDSFAVSYTVNGGESVEATLSLGTGGFADYYYFVVEGIPAAEYKSVKIAVTVTADGLQPRTTTVTGTRILSDLAALDGENPDKYTDLSKAIGEYADALNAFVAEKEIPAGEVKDVTDDEINVMLAKNSDNKSAISIRTELAPGVTAAAVNLTVSDVVSLNYYLKLEEGASITAAAVGSKTLDNGLTLTTRTVDNEEYAVISVECRADELAKILSLTVNDSENEFNACALSYAKALKSIDANLAQAVANYAYYVDQYAPKAA